MIARNHGPAARNPIVAIARTHPGIKKALREALDGIGGLSKFIREGEKVFVKPNLTGEREPSTGAVTNPQVIKALIELIYERRPAKVYLGDSPSWGFNAEKVYQISGAKRVAEETGCILINLDKDDKVECTIHQAWRLKKIPIAKTILECDKWINVPVMKTHMQCLVSLGIKNVKGILPLKSKTKLHELKPKAGYSGLEVGVADLHRLIRPDLTVLDGTIGMEGRGPFDGDPVKLGLIIAGEDPVRVDAVGAAIMGFDPREIPSLRLCAEIDGIDLQDYQIVGPAIHSVKRNFKPCPTEVYEGENIRVYTGEVCSGCLATLNTAIHRLMKSHDLEKVSGLALGIGKNPNLPPEAGKRLYVGKCAAMGEWLQQTPEVIVVKGCPPTGWKIVQGIKDAGQ
jgi:uncharacterized protein (DUF362 family)